MAKEIDERAPSRREQPGLRILRNAVSRPGSQCPHQSLAQGVFGTRHVLGLHRKIGHQTAVRLTRHSLDGPVSLLFLTSTHSTILRLVSGARGRTSTAPYEAAGQRAAHSRAASSDGNSRMVNPPSCSFVSA